MWRECMGGLNEPDDSDRPAQVGGIGAEGG